MVLSLGHIHGSEEPPSTALVIAGHPGHQFGVTGAPPRLSPTRPGRDFNHFAPNEASSQAVGKKQQQMSLKVTVGKALFRAGKSFGDCLDIEMQEPPFTSLPGGQHGLDVINESPTSH